MSHRTLTVDLGARSYPIHIGPDLLGRADLYRPALAGDGILVVTNETVAPLYLDRVLAGLADRNPGSLILPDGERHKTLETAGRIYDELMNLRVGRDGTVVALGGGVIGDLAGFAAATWQRGIGFVQIPTTLLAQVDSSVGGKTGVNHPQGKNMIGAFHQPRLVLADTDVLATLPERELSAGLAEVIKYGLIRDAEFFDWLEANIDALRTRKPDVLIDAIARSCENKAAVVAADEREVGDRALLNLGHTFGHAIETALGYGDWLHGEAVGAGMCLAAELSMRLGWLDEADRDRVVALVTAAGLPTTLPAGLSRERILDLMAHDKKVLAGRMRLVLLKAIGEAVVTEDFPGEILEAILDASIQSG